jgi:hypothetical protein
MIAMALNLSERLRRQAKSLYLATGDINDADAIVMDEAAKRIDELEAAIRKGIGLSVLETKPARRKGANAEPV